MTVHVGGARDMGQRFSEAFRRAAAGEDFEEQHVTFLSLEEMLSALTPKRLELLRYLRKNEVDSIKALAQELGRDYKRVHEDVKILETAGLIVREAGRFGAPWAEIAAEVAL
jgi:predicted transcriptional regulator